jgi:hypothetical protein
VTFHVYRGRAGKGRTIEQIEGRPARWLKRGAVGGLGISRACEAVLAVVSGC